MVATGVEGTVYTWLVEFLAEPRTDLSRAGALCPFIKPALRASAIRYRTVRTPRSPELGEIAGAAREAMDRFTRLDWGAAPEQLQCLVVMFPDLDSESAVLLDRVHAELKDAVVERGLMFAQFHPRCTEASVRNPEVKVGGAPVPLLAFRRLAVHDILFLGDRAAWFAAFSRRFGHRFRPPSKLEPVLMDAYRNAASRLGKDLDGES